VADPIDSNTALGEAVRRLRGSTTQEELGLRIGQPQSWISRIETGQVDVKWSTVGRLADGLGVSVAELVAAVEGSEKVKKPPA
jgi:transcriptional regulator with XRE-family HTH domain